MFFLRRCIYTYDEGGRFLNRILADALGQPVGPILRSLRAHQYPPNGRILRALEQPRPTIACLHLTSQALGVGAVAESAHLNREQPPSGVRRRADDFRSEEHTSELQS